MRSFHQQRREQKDVRPFSISFLVEIQGEKYMKSQMFSERQELGWQTIPSRTQETNWKVCIQPQAELILGMSPLQSKIAY